MLAVAIEVADGRERRAGARAEQQRHAEGSIALAQKHRNRRRLEVGQHQIRPAIAIEIAYGHRRRTIIAAEEDRRRPEGPIAVAQQHRNGAGKIVDYSQIQRAVAIEVGRGYRPRSEIHPEGVGCGERCCLGQRGPGTRHHEHGGDDKESEVCVAHQFAPIATPVCGHLLLS